MKSPLVSYPSLVALIAATHHIVQSSGSSESAEQLEDLEQMNHELKHDTSYPDWTKIEHATLKIHDLLAEFDPRVAMTSLAAVTATTGAILGAALVPNGSHPWSRPDKDFSRTPAPGVEESRSILETLRNKGKVIIASGHKTALRMILGDFGVSALSEVAPGRLQELDARLDEWSTGQIADLAKVTNDDNTSGTTALKEGKVSAVLDYTLSRAQDDGPVPKENDGPIETRKLSEDEVKVAKVAKVAKSKK